MPSMSKVLVACAARDLATQWVITENASEKARDWIWTYHDFFGVYP